MHQMKMAKQLFKCCRLVTAAMSSRCRPGREEVVPRLLIFGNCRSLGMILVVFSPSLPMDTYKPNYSAFSVVSRWDQVPK